MVKIIGKILSILFLFACVTLCYTAQVTMKVVSFDNIELEQAAVGQPFILEITAKGVDSNTALRPKIKGLQGFDFGNTGIEMRTKNGDTTIKYKYRVVIDTKDEYEIGPAEIEYLGDIIKSNKVTIKIGDTQKEKNGGVKKRKTTKTVKLNFSADKTNVFVGEKVTVTLRFYYLEGAEVTFDRFTPGIAKGINQGKKIEKSIGTKKVDDDIYKYIELQWHVFPTQTGKVTLPANRADFFVRGDDGIFGFSSFFQERKYTYSNAITLHVDPLPPYNGTVNAVGDFTAFTATVDRAVAKEGDGIVLTLEVMGDGDLGNLDIAQLQGMPKTLKYYESKQYIVDTNGVFESNKKRFEFIVQGLEKGEWLIPKQTFTYFDVIGKEYKTLKTTSIMLKILPQPVSVYKSKKNMKQDIAKPQVAKSDTIRPLMKIGKWYLSEPKEIPFIIFIILLLLPFLLLVFSWAKRVVAYYSEQYTPQRLKKYAFSYACKHLKIAASKKDMALLYPLFMRFFAQRFSLQEADISQDTIVQILQKKDFSLEEINAWENFFEQIAALAFYEKYKEMAYNKEIFDQAFEWLALFKKRL